MDHIPVEILHFIFIQLDLKDKLECMLVCRLWYNTLDQRSLLHTLRISYRQFQGFKDMVERLPYRGTQVGKLDVFINSDFDKRKLCNMFPNLRELHLYASIDSIRDQNYRSTKFDFIYPTKLERIADFSHCELICQLAMSNLVRHVSYLGLDLSYLSESTVINILSQLKNMPVLETLHLSRFKVKLMHLEILHSNLGSIKYLDLCHLRLCTGEMPQNVTPATLITKMECLIEYSDDLHTHIQFYKYMYKKYPSVSRPEYYDLELTRLGDDDYAREVYTKGIFPLYQDIGSQIDTFRFQTYCEGMNAFRKFDEYDFKLKDLQLKSSYVNNGGDLFLEELVQSNQAKYIQRLHLEDIIPLSLVKLKHMKILHTLRIDRRFWHDDPDYSRKKIINFSQFIKACPATLSKLTIKDIGFTFSDSQLNPTCINYLELTPVELTRDLAKIIETIFPKLSTLILKGDLKSSLEISLPNHNLEKVSISTKVTKYSGHGFLTKTTNDDKIQYHAPREDSCRYLYGYRVIPVTKEEFDATLVLNFTCASVKELILAIH